MHEKVLEAIMVDAVAYARHDGPCGLLDKWSKEQLAFALDAMAVRLRILRETLNANIHGSGPAPDVSRRPPAPPPPPRVPTAEGTEP